MSNVTSAAGAVANSNARSHEPQTLAYLSEHCSAENTGVSSSTQVGSPG